MNSFWPISKRLLNEILFDHTTDRFLKELVWQRLGYISTGQSEYYWKAGPDTPNHWKKYFEMAPEIISSRKASVHLTRSIPK